MAWGTFEEEGGGGGGRRGLEVLGKRNLDDVVEVVMSLGWKEKVFSGQWCFPLVILQVKRDYLGVCESLSSPLSIEFRFVVRIVDMLWLISRSFVILLERYTFLLFEKKRRFTDFEALGARFAQPARCAEYAEQTPHPKVVFQGKR